MSNSSYRNAKADKQLQDKMQALLSHLLREEDNKYCADCDAKGKLSQAAASEILFRFRSHIGQFSKEWLIDADAVRL